MTQAINDRKLALYRSNGGTSDEINDAAYEFLVAQGATPGQLNDMWYEYLTGAGLEGALSDMLPLFWGLDGPPVPLRAFLAAAPGPSGAMELQVYGQGTPTSTHVSTILSPDHEGVYREFTEDEPVWRDGRVVENLLQYPEDLTQPSIWTLRDGLTATKDTFTVVNAASDFSTTTQALGPSDYWNGRKGILSFTVSGDTTPLRVEVVDGGDGSDSIAIDFTVPETDKRISMPFDYSAATSTGELVLYVNRDSAATVGSTIKFTEVMVEDSTGRQDTATPSEYIPRDTVSLGVPSGKKTFNYANGNTVDGSGVVTPAKGLPLDPQPTLAYNPAATNTNIYSRDLTDPTWTVQGNATTAFDAVGITGEPNTASTIYVEGGGHTVFSYVTGATPAAPAVSKVWIKRITTTGILEIQSPDGGVYGEYLIDLSLLSDDWELIDPYHPAVTSYTPFVVSPTGNYGNQFVCTTGASLIVGNAELHLNKTIQEVRELPPIITEAAPVSIDRTVYGFDISNHDDTQGGYYLEVESDGDQDILDGFLSQIDPNYSLSDGTTSTTGAIGSGIDKVGIAYSAEESLMAIAVNGSWSTDVAYDGTLLSGALDLFRTGSYPARIRNIQRYQGGTYQEIKDKIGAL